MSSADTGFRSVNYMLVAGALCAPCHIPSACLGLEQKSMRTVSMHSSTSSASLRLYFKLFAKHRTIEPGTGLYGTAGELTPGSNPQLVEDRS